MANKGWLWFAGVASVVAGCSGKVSDDGVGDPGGAGRAGASNSAGDAGAGGDAGGDAGAGGEPSCVGTLAEVGNTWGFSCPREVCDANVLASGCSALPGGTRKTSFTSCFDDQILSFEISPTRRKDCYYGSGELDGVSRLIGAAVWDDEARFCNGSSTRIHAGQDGPRTPDDCELVTTLCDLVHPEQGHDQDGSHLHACYNRFGHSCEVCCPATAPDCSDKPQNYPGYSCTPDDPGDASYCSCDCQHGEWVCEC